MALYADETAPLPERSEPRPYWKDKGSRLTFRRYMLGLLVIFLTSYSQYLGGFRAVGGAFIVYGCSIFATTLLYGRAIAGRSLSNTRMALTLGPAFFGVFTVLGGITSMLILTLLGYFDPSAILIAAACALISVVSGIFLSFAFDVPAGALIVLLNFGFFLVLLCCKGLFRGRMGRQ